MKRIRSGRMGLLLTALVLALPSSRASAEALVKTSKGYRLSILPAMGAEKVERKPKATRGRVRVQSLRESVYGGEEAPKQSR